MKKRWMATSFCAMMLFAEAQAQDLKEKDVPTQVKTSLIQKFPDAKKVSWEKEKGNFEANWGGKSGEDNSAIFTTSGEFMEIVQAIQIDKLPSSVSPYVAKHYSGAKIKEAGWVTNSGGKHFYEVEIKGKDLIFDEKGMFLKED